MSELAFELLIPLLRTVQEARLAMLGCVLVIAEDDIDHAIERLEQARDLDVTELPKGRQRDLARHIGKYAGSLAHDLNSIKEKL